MANKVCTACLLALAFALTANYTHAQSSSSDDDERSIESDSEPTPQSDESRAEPEQADDPPIRVIAAPDRNRRRDDDELVCRRIQVIGTHRRIRRCFTRAQLEEQQEEAQEFLRNRTGRDPVDTGSN